MIILEPGSTSRELATYLATSRTPVLDNAGARAAPLADQLNRVDEARFLAGLADGARLYTTSENSLSWVLEHVPNPMLARGIGLMKDKHALRETLRPLYPDYWFHAVDADALAAVDPATLPLPVVLKPVVGFFSVGVHMIATSEDWRAAAASVAAQRHSWNDEYAATVVGNGRFLVEQCIDGDEYAIDAYYDANGEAVVVNIMRHEFASAADVSDRLYYTSPEIIRARLGEFTDYLNRVGALLQLRDFPFHLEVRVSPAGIVPIEFNPLRFAGMCTTDIAWFAYGIHTYGHYLEGKRPDWDAALAGRDGNLYSLVILDKATAGTATGLDWARLESGFTDVLCRREVSDGAVWGFLFTRTPAAAREELDRIVRSDLTEYLLHDR